MLRMFSYASYTSTLTNQGPFFPNVRNVCFPPYVSPDSVTVPATLLHAFRHNSQCTSGINWYKNSGLQTNKTTFFITTFQPSIQTIKQLDHQPMSWHSHKYRFHFQLEVNKCTNYSSVLYRCTGMASKHWNNVWENNNNSNNYYKINNTQVKKKASAGQMPVTIDLEALLVIIGREWQQH